MCPKMQMKPTHFLGCVLDIGTQEKTFGTKKPAIANPFTIENLFPCHQAPKWQFLKVKCWFPPQCGSGLGGAAPKFLGPGIPTPNPSGVIPAMGVGNTILPLICFPHF